jgi:hypothetical protein
MPAQPPYPPPPGHPNTHPIPVGSTGGKGAPVAPKAVASWTRFSGALATQLPTALRQARTFRRAGMKALR